MGAKAHEIDDDDRALIATALQVAAESYRADVTTISETKAREGEPNAARWAALAEAFAGYAPRLDALAEAFQGAAAVSISGGEA